MTLDNSAMSYKDELFSRYGSPSREAEIRNKDMGLFEAP